MSDEAALLCAITATPDDDTPRLVYADWLDDHDLPGGAFVRTDCDLAPLSAGSAQWREVFVKLRAAREGLSDEWCESVTRRTGAKGLASSARNAWARLEGWCRRHHPGLFGIFNPGATAEELEQVEQAIGQPLPADVRESLAIHNGTNENFLFFAALLGTTSITSIWNVWLPMDFYNDDYRDGMSSFPAEAIALDYANRGWIPLTDDAGSCHLGVDLAPGSSGTVGQVINFGKHERQKCALATSWADFLADFASFLESGAVAKFYDEPDLWGESCSDALRKAYGNRNYLTLLCELRRDGRWPPQRGGRTA
jgi:uncharacterized protein (TIGR02996 family)